MQLISLYLALLPIKRRSGEASFVLSWDDDIFLMSVSAKVLSCALPCSRCCQLTAAQLFGKRISDGVGLVNFLDSFLFIRASKRRWVSFVNLKSIFLTADLEIWAESLSLDLHISTVSSHDFAISLKTRNSVRWTTLSSTWVNATL